MDIINTISELSNLIEELDEEGYYVDTDAEVCPDAPIKLQLLSRAREALWEYQHIVNSEHELSYDDYYYR